MALPGGRRTQQWPLPPRADLVSQFPLQRRSRRAGSTRSKISRRRVSSTWRSRGKTRRAGCSRAEGHALNHLESTEELYADVATCELARRRHFRVAAASRGRCLSREARQGADDHRRLSVVWRLGTRHVHRAARALHRDGPARRRARYSRGMGRRRFGGDAAESLSRSRRDSRSSTPSTPRSGMSSPSTIYLRAKSAANATFIADCHTQKLRDGDRSDSRRLPRRHAFRHPRRRRRLARLRRTRRQLTWMDAKVGRLGRHAAHRQAGRDSGAVDQCAVRSARNFRRAGRRYWRKAAPVLRRALLERRGRLPLRCDRLRSSTWRGRSSCFARIKSLPSAACRSCFFRPANAHVKSSMRSKRSCSRRSACARLRPANRVTSAHYGGGVAQRDGSYHQGTVWPWLIGPFVEAWLRVRGHSAEAKAEAAERFIAPLLEHLNHAGLGHISEIADADSPHTPAGCPFQAWSLGELLRLDSLL